MTAVIVLGSIAGYLAVFGALVYVGMRIEVLGHDTTTYNVGLIAFFWPVSLAVAGVPWAAARLAERAAKSAAERNERIQDDRKRLIAKIAELETELGKRGAYR